MLVYFTEEVTSDIKEKISFISNSKTQLDSYFSEKEYGKDLDVIYISLVGVHPRFGAFFKARKPKYVSVAKEYIEKGIMVHREGRSLSYDLFLDFSKYINEKNPAALLSQDLLNSLETITSIKKIKDFNLPLFHSDLNQFFKLNGWL